MKPRPSTSLSHFSKWDRDRDRDALVGLNLPEVGAELSSRDWCGGCVGKGEEFLSVSSGVIILKPPCRWWSTWASSFPYQHTAFQLFHHYTLLFGFSVHTFFFAFHICFSFPRTLALYLSLQISNCECFTVSPMFHFFLFQILLTQMLLCLSSSQFKFRQFCFTAQCLGFFFFPLELGV